MSLELNHKTLSEDGTNLDCFIGGERNTVTVVFRPVGKPVKKNQEYHIGVSRCGDGQRYQEELGIDIAAHRSQISPYAKVETDTPETLKVVAQTIASHMSNHARQPQFKCHRLPKNQVKSLKRQNQRKNA